MQLWKLLSSKQKTLAHEYFSYWAVMVMIVFASVSWLSYSSFRDFEINSDKFVKDEARKIQRVFDEKITYTEHILQFIGTKIRLSGNLSGENIAGILATHKDTFTDDTFSWHMLNYVRPDYVLICDSINGLRKQPIKLDAEKRPWLNEAKEDYWKIKFALPSQGVISDDYIIPSGMGMYDTKTNRFLGYLAVGISIDRLTTSLMKVLGKNIDFMIFDKSGNFMTGSELRLESKNILLPEHLLHQTAEQGMSVDELNVDLDAGRIAFSYLIDSKKYPFKILIGRNHVYHMQEFQKEILPKIAMYCFLGVILSMAVAMLCMKSIEPIIAFSKAAEAVSKGKSISLKQYDAVELKILVEQLTNLSVITKELHKKQCMMTALNNDLQEANEFIKSNMSFLSHELINPISSIIGFTDILNKKLLDHKDAEVKEVIEMLAKIARYQHKQLNFFLKMFRFQEAGKTVEFKQIDLHNVIEWNLSMVMHHIREKDIKISLDIEKDLKMYGDEIMIGQLVQNLVSNAAKYNKFGGEIRIVARSRQGNKIIIDFIDNGIGMAEENLSKIFKKFERVYDDMAFKKIERAYDDQKNRSSKQIGYGVGLTYALQCAQAHGGKISVQSTPEVGTTFTVELRKA